MLFGLWRTKIAHDAYQEISNIITEGIASFFSLIIPDPDSVAMLEADGVEFSRIISDFDKSIWLISVGMLELLILKRESSLHDSLAYLPVSFMLANKNRFATQTYYSSILGMHSHQSHPRSKEPGFRASRLLDNFRAYYIKNNSIDIRSSINNANPVDIARRLYAVNRPKGLSYNNIEYQFESSDRPGNARFGRALDDITKFESSLDSLGSDFVEKLAGEICLYVEKISKYKVVYEGKCPKSLSSADEVMWVDREAKKPEVRMLSEPFDDIYDYPDDYDFDEDWR